MRKLLSILAFLALGGLSGPALANVDEGLYDPLPPEGSAFVRFVNARIGDGSEPASAAGKTLDYLHFKEISSYFVVPEGDVTAEIGDSGKDFEVDAGGFYTVVIEKDGELKVYRDEQSDNRAKAQIIFYNFDPQSDLSLKTNDGKVEVIPAVATAESGAQLINPVKVPLAVYNGDRIVEDLGALSLERSQSYSVVVFPDKEARFIKGTTNTLR